MNALALTATLDGDEHQFFTIWTESVCKQIALRLNTQHAVFTLYGQRVSYQRAWRSIEEWFND